MADRIQQEYYKNLVIQMDVMRSESFLTDITLSCEDKNYPVHKLLLSAVSPFFKNLFQIPENNNQPSLKIDFVSSKVLEVILLYCYTGLIIIPKQTTKFLKDLLEASTTLQISQLYKHCIKLFMNHSSPDQFLKSWKKKDVSNDEMLKKIFMENLINNLAALKEREEFLNLSNEQLHSLLESPMIASLDHEAILECILAWVRHDVELRQQFFKGFLDKLDFDKLRNSCLLNLLDDPLFEDNLHFLKFCSKTFHKQLGTKPKKGASNATPRNSPEKTMSIHRMVCDRLTAAAASPKHEVPANRNQAKVQFDENGEEIEVPRNVDCISKLQNNLKHKVNVNIRKIRNIFVYGIQSCFTNEKGKIFQFDWEKNKWEDIGDSPLSGIRNAAICSYGDCIYSFGGSSIGMDNRTLNSCYVYDTVKNLWHQTKGMITCRYYASAVALNNCIYVVGGYDSSHNRLKTVECFELRSGTWKIVTELPIDTECFWGHLPLITIEGRLCLILTNKLLWYCPKTNKWETTCINLPVEMGSKHLRIINISGKIYIIQKYCPLTMFIYDTVNQTLTSDKIPINLNRCNAIINLENRGKTEFLVIGANNSFIHQPPSSWEPFETPDVDCSQAAIVKSVNPRGLKAIEITAVMFLECAKNSKQCRPQTRKLESTKKFRSF